MLTRSEKMRLRRERAEAVAAALKTGARVKDIAAAHDLSPAYVSTVARKAGLGRYQRAAAHYPAIAAAYASGKSLAAVAQEFGVGRKIVWAACRQQGVALRKSNLGRPRVERPLPPPPRATGSGPRCPCGGTGSHTCETRRAEDRIVRVRRCDACGKNFATVERTVDWCGAVTAINLTATLMEAKR